MNDVPLSPGPRLSGWQSLALQLPVVFVLCYLFWQLLVSVERSAAEDRQLTRDAIQAIQKDSQRQWQAIEKNTAILERINYKLNQ